MLACSRYARSVARCAVVDEELAVEEKHGAIVRAQGKGIRAGDWKENVPRDPHEGIVRDRNGLDVAASGSDCDIGDDGCVLGRGSPERVRG